MSRNIIDVEIVNHGSIVLLTPLTELASEWIEENVSIGSLWHGRSMAVDPRYLAGIVEGMFESGLNLEV